jgi:spore coat protein U-like protein
LFGILALLGLGSAWAGSASDQFNVTATVLTNCQIMAGNTLAFGNYDPLSATATDSATTIQVRCTKGTTATVKMGDGLNFSGGTRRMSFGTNFLNYGLFQGAARAQPWGTGSDAVT